MDNDQLLIAIKDIFEKKVEEVKREVADVKNHMGVIAEDLKSDVKAVAEGYSIIDRKIDNLQEDMDRKYDNLQKDMDTVKNYIIAVDTKLNEHEIILKRVK